MHRAQQALPLQQRHPLPADHPHPGEIQTPAPGRTRQQDRRPRQLHRHDQDLAAASAAPRPPTTCRGKSSSARIRRSAITTSASAAAWTSAVTMSGRSGTPGRFLYIRNYMPYAPWGQHLNYLWTMKATQAWEAHYKAGKTDAVTGRFFGTKPMEELYDTSADPDNVVNLIDEPQHAAEIERLSAALDQWQLRAFRFRPAAGERAREALGAMWQDDLRNGARPGALRRQGATARRRHGPGGRSRQHRDLLQEPARPGLGRPLLGDRRAVQPEEG